MKFGLTDEDIAAIVDVLRACPDVTEALIFGSRALGRHRPESDVDIAVRGRIASQQIAELRGALDRLPLPWLFDVVALATLSDRAVKQHIERVGRPLFRRGASERGSSAPSWGLAEESATALSALHLGDGDTP